MQIFSGFMLVREQPLPELNERRDFTVTPKTGAELLSLVNDDDNKVFGVTFRTPPRNSTLDARRRRQRRRRPPVRRGAELTHHHLANAAAVKLGGFFI